MSPNDVIDFKQSGYIGFPLVHTSDDKYTLIQEGGYTRYIPINVNNKEGLKMYEYAMDEFMSPTDYSAWLFNCGTFVLDIIRSSDSLKLSAICDSAGSNHIISDIYKTLPNYMYESFTLYTSYNIIKQ